MKEEGKGALSPIQEKVAELQEQKQLEMLKKGEYVGAFRVHEFYAQFARYMALVEKIRLVENNTQKAYGMDVKTFCKEKLGISYTVFQVQRDLLKDAQIAIIAAIKAMGYSDNEIRLLKTSEDEAVKALIGKGMLTVNDVEIQTTPENLPKIMKHFEKVIRRKDELEAEKEELNKKLLSKYDMADRNKKLEEKNKKLEDDNKSWERKYERAKHGLTEDDIRSHNAIQGHKDQFSAIITLMETADVNSYSSKTRAEFVTFAEYMHDRVLLMYDLILNTHQIPGKDTVPDGILEDNKKWFIEKYGEGAL